MPNQPVAVKTPQLKWTDFLRLFSPDGERQITELIVVARQKYGRRWLEGVKAEFPDFCWLIDLAANKTADEAFAEITTAFPNVPVKWVKTQIQDMHGRVRAEIDKKQF